MKTFALLGTVLFIGTVFLKQYLETPFTFPSAESRTQKNKIVYNEITWKHENGKDIWLMKQSHGGPDLPKNDWDDLKIVVQKGRARFYQMKNGKDVPFTVSCFMCHPNGPRAIRPDVTNKLSLGEKAKIALINLRIKTYGRIIAENNSQNQVGDIPFRHPGKMSNAHLTLTACTKCHSEKGIFPRGFLTRQNAVTIDFMVRQDHMPPIGKLSQEEQSYLRDFIDGL